MLIGELQSGMTKGLTPLTDVKVNVIDSSIDWSEMTHMGIMFFD